MPDHGAALRLVVRFCCAVLRCAARPRPPVAPWCACWCSTPSPFCFRLLHAIASAAAHARPNPSPIPRQARFLHSAFSPQFEAEVLGVGHRVVHGASIGESVLVE